MAASAAITLAVKAAAVAATDKRARPAIASVVIAVFLPFILMTFIILSALDGTSTISPPWICLSMAVYCLQTCGRSTGSISRTSGKASRAWTV